VILFFEKSKLNGNYMGPVGPENVLSAWWWLARLKIQNSDVCPVRHSLISMFMGKKPTFLSTGYGRWLGIAYSTRQPPIALCLQETFSPL
jgi:hypothetical protein